MTMRLFLGFCALSVALLAGCKAYRWTPTVPPEVRTVSVPTFRNETNVMELGAVMSRQVLREFQREGTFRLASSDEAAIEIQGIVRKANHKSSAYDRRAGMRTRTYDVSAVVTVSVVDRRAGKVLVDNRDYTAQTQMTAGQDLTTGMRDASGRLADDLARQVVDDVLNLKW